MASPAQVEIAGELEPLEDAEARAILDRAIDRYIAARHARVAGFVDRNFSLIGSLRLHRRALGLDLLRALVNVLLMVPHLSLQLSGMALRRLGGDRAARRLRGRALFLDTDVGRELCWRLHTELLELPYDDGRRRSEHDALAETVLADPRVAPAVERLAALARSHTGAPERRARLRRMLAAYAGTRAAAADLVNNGLLASFPLGASVGSVWYGLFPAAPSVGLVAGATGGLVLLTATTAALAGVIADPLQRACGLHQRRLHRLIDALGRELKGDSDAAFHARDHYLARIDLARAGYRGL